MAFLSLCQGERVNYQKNLILDCANGVGSIVMQEFLGLAGVEERLKVTMINDDKMPDKLNDQCGAEYVQKD